MNFNSYILTFRIFIIKLKYNFRIKHRQRSGPASESSSKPRQREVTPIYARPKTCLPLDMH